MRDCLPGSHTFERGALTCRCGVVTTDKRAQVPRCEACGHGHWDGKPIALQRLKGRTLCANCRKAGA